MGTEYNISEGARDTLTPLPHSLRAMKSGIGIPGCKSVFRVLLFTVMGEKRTRRERQANNSEIIRLTLRADEG